ncbi:MAG: mannose-6-phosphate isomerase [Herbinix sp.]|jgi:glucokinase|nr:mannose-6-phosphate isomerase [Herbinix sp.]
MKALGIDLGGTQIKFGVVESGEILHECSIDTCVKAGYKAVIEQITAQSTELLQIYPDIGNIGLGSPGIIDITEGIVRYSNNFGWRDVPICHDIEQVLQRKVRIANDAQCAALGEALYGAGRNTNRMAMFTIGTGVGGGFVKDGKLETDSYGSIAYIFGHSVISYKGEECNCERLGCLEAYASAGAIERNGKKILNIASAREIFEAARNKDIQAQKLVDEFLEYLSVGIVNIANILRPRIIVIGGGVSGSGDLILPKINMELQKGVYGYTYAPVQAVCAQMGNHAGIIGAANL